MQRKLILNTALCATLCRATNTRSLVQEVNEEWADLLIDLEAETANVDFQTEGLAQARSQMMTATEVATSVTGLAQLISDVGDDTNARTAQTAAA